MGTQRPVVIGGDLAGELGSPMAEHHGKKKEKVKSKKEKVKEKIKSVKELGAAKVIEKPSVKMEESAEKIEKEKPKKIKKGKAKIRSKKYKAALDLIDRNKLYDVKEAIELVKKTSLTRFDGNVEAHIRIINKANQPESLRGLIKYPYSTGKKIKVVILDEKLIGEILKTKKTDFDLALANPEMMSHVAKLAKILGPRGKMPNPKSGTITSEPQKTKKEFEEGRGEFKTDSFGIIHQVIGKVSFETEKIEENLKTLLLVLPPEKISTIYLCPTMGPAVKVGLR